jgi:GNAT superfamily N-acetyltransferase
MNQDYDEVLSGAQVFIAEDEAGVQGVLVLRLDDEGFLLENVAVHPRVKGQGLGKRLLALAEREAIAQGHDSIYLYTHERMATNIDRYLAHGYTEFARRHEHGFARVFLRKALAAQLRRK